MTRPRRLVAGAKPSSTRPPLTALGAVLLSLAAAAAACSRTPEGLPGEVAPTALAARGGHSGGSGSTSSDPTVTAVDPDTVTQDTTVDVTVSGSDFDPSSQVEITLNDTTVHGVMTNSTRYVNSRKLVASLTMAPDASTGSFDVTVLSVHGRKGVGSELLTIKEALFTPTIVTVLDQPGDNIRSDGLGPYVDGECGVVADFNGKDARLDPDADYKGKQKHSGCTPRTLHFDLVNEAGDIVRSTDVGAFMNVDHVETVTPGMGTVRRTGQFDFGFCNILRFDPDDIYVGPNGSGELLVSASVDATGRTVWTVSTDPNNDRAYCETDSTVYHVPFHLEVRLE